MNRLSALTPPMGWNSWDCYGASVTEEEVLGNAEYMANHLKKYGWEYIVVDIQWYEPTANSSAYNPFAPLCMDEYGRLLPATNRFPSAKNGAGFKPLSDAIHDLGLKFGIHIMRGIPRQAVYENSPVLGSTKTAREIAHINSICPWNTDMYGVDPTKEGAQSYYNSLFELYAQWGVDFVKVDDIAASRLYDTHLEEIKMIQRAIHACGRPMVLSLSPGPAPIKYAHHFKTNANMWRISDDFWDDWSLLYQMFERCEVWEKHIGTGHWPDCDMLPLGHIGIRSVDGPGGDRWTRFTKDEQLTMMNLWAISRSPLMFGGELRDNDQWTLSLLTNEEILSINQKSVLNRFVYREEDKVAWAANGRNGEAYVALFNLHDQQKTLQFRLDMVGIMETVHLFNVWDRSFLQSLAPSESFQIELKPHQSMMLKLSPDQ